MQERPNDKKKTLNIKAVSRSDCKPGADLSYADFYDLELYEVKLMGASLMGAQLYKTNLCGADLRRADLRCLFTLADLSFADMRYAELHDVDLSSTDLTGADLSGANLIGATLMGAKFFPDQMSTGILTEILSDYQSKYIDDVNYIALKPAILHSFMVFVEKYEKENDPDDVLKYLEAALHHPFFAKHQGIASSLVNTIFAEQRDDGHNKINTDSQKVIAAEISRINQLKLTR